MDWLYLYVLGYLIVVAGVALGLNLIGVPALWILMVVALLLALGLLTLRSPKGGGGGG